MYCQADQPGNLFSENHYLGKTERNALTSTCYAPNADSRPRTPICKLVSGEEIDLTHLEFRLVRLLTSRPGYIFTNEEIIRAVWGSKGENDQTALKNVIYRLRKKLGKKSEYMIQTSPGGYSFQEN